MIIIIYKYQDKQNIKEQNIKDIYVCGKTLKKSKEFWLEVTLGAGRRQWGWGHHEVPAGQGVVFVEKL